MRKPDDFNGQDGRDLFAAPPLPIAALDGRERIACLRLIRSENVGPTTFRELINFCGGAQAAIDALPELSRRGGRRRQIRVCTREAAEAELEAAERIGAQPVFTIEPGYPAALAAVDVPPPMLYAKGRLELLSRPSVGIVGSRQSSAGGMKLARLIADGLGAAGIIVASGLARGVDSAAHEAALASGTVAVLAGGLDVVYPPENRDLQHRIGVEGCLLSEQPPGFVPRGQDFPRRNRIISGISHGVVVVEAARRSGSLITARMANEQGRMVFAVPGHPLDPRAEGTNRLIKMGEAQLVTEAADIIEQLEPQIGASLRTDWAEAQPEAPRPVPPPLLSQDDRDRVLSALGPAPVDIDEIARAAGLPIRGVRLILVELDLAGRIEHHGQQLVSLKS